MAILASLGGESSEGLCCAGRTHLNWDAEQAEEVGVIPTGVELFAFDAAFFGGLPFQQVQRQAAERGQILSGVASARPALVFVHRHFQLLTDETCWFLVADFDKAT